MTVSTEMEKAIIESVLQELSKRGVVGKQGSEVVEKAKEAAAHEKAKEPILDEVIELPDISKHWVPEPANPEALEAMKKSTNARIGLYRAGTRQKTDSLIRFLADHAVARDAVFMDVSEEFLQKMNLFCVASAAADKEEFLTKPDLGTKLSDEAVKIIKEKCEKDVQVQIIAVDGLSSTAIERNIPDILPALMQGFKAAGIKVGTPFFVKNGRVRVMDQIGMLLNAEVVLELIGERPGLGTAESMSAYLIYKPTEKTVEADRTMISNIHKRGTPPAEAGAQIVDLVKQMLEKKASGIKLNKALKD
ncbi:MAG: ethanolamine ammonia-lyase subunit EutC [Clostridia bacterium]|jgi:ethanolamine ammonia-lyase small subunit|nr:ethanolamine ammonia-lyase subunit EutC [Clostridia bacterium]